MPPASITQGGADRKLVVKWECAGVSKRESRVIFRLQPVDRGTQPTLIHPQTPDEEDRRRHAQGVSGLLGGPQAFRGGGRMAGCAP
jgi:hypothetical protein